MIKTASSAISRVTLYTAGHLHTAVPYCSHSRAPIVHTAVPRENNEHGCVYLRCRAVCKLPGCVEGHPCICTRLKHNISSYNLGIPVAPKQTFESLHQLVEYDIMIIYSKNHTLRIMRMLPMQFMTLYKTFEPKPIWEILCQNKVSRTGTSNCFPYILWDVITCPYFWYPLLALKSLYIRSYPCFRK